MLLSFLGFHVVELPPAALRYKRRILVQYIFWQIGYLHVNSLPGLSSFGLGLGYNLLLATRVEERVVEQMAVGSNSVGMSSRRIIIYGSMVHAGEAES